MKKVITISREFGSGGREIGFCLAEKLGIPFYDKEIISMAAQDSNIAEDVFHAHDEFLRHQDRTDHEYVSVNPFSVLYEVPVQDQLFMAQSQIIRRLEQAGPCVIIGRCSDIIVENGFHVFICAGMKKRAERMSRLEAGESPKKMEARIREIDQRRRDYYQYYSGNEWGNPKNYHLSLNSGKLGTDLCVKMILACLEADSSEKYDNL
jgi:cytidylate kinase